MRGKIKRVHVSFAFTKKKVGDSEMVSVGKADINLGGFLWLLLGVMYGSHFLIESRVRNQPLRSANISYRLAARTTPTPLDCYFLVRGLFD